MTTPGQKTPKVGRDLHMTSIENGMRYEKSPQIGELVIEPQVDPRMRNMNTLPNMNSTGIIMNGRRKRSVKENMMLGSRVKI